MKIVTVQKTMKLLDKKTFKVEEIKEVDSDGYLKPVQERVEGWIEIVHPRGLSQGMSMVVNEEGHLLGLAPNLFGSKVYDGSLTSIVGNVVVCREKFSHKHEGYIFSTLLDKDIELLRSFLSSLGYEEVKE